jgi:hypothetical protein
MMHLALQIWLAPQIVLGLWLCVSVVMKRGEAK